VNSLSWWSWDDALSAGLFCTQQPVLTGSFAERHLKRSRTHWVRELIEFVILRRFIECRFLMHTSAVTSRALVRKKTCKDKTKIRHPMGFGCSVWKEGLCWCKRCNILQRTDTRRGTLTTVAHRVCVCTVCVCTLQHTTTTRYEDRDSADSCLCVCVCVCVCVCACVCVCERERERSAVLLLEQGPSKKKKKFHKRYGN